MNTINQITPIMKIFTAKTFSLSPFGKITTKTIEEHMKLYHGYVKNTNLILEKVAELRSDPEKNTYTIGEINRRFGFEFNGMRNHEVYFNSLEGGSHTLSKKSQLITMISETWGSFDAWLIEFKTIALTRGIGWAMLYYDRNDKRLLNAWVDEQHIGQLQDCALILGLDMWEHSFVADYEPSGKKSYIDDFFANINWENIANAI